VAVPGSMSDNEVLAQRLGVTALDLTVVESSRRAPSLQRVVLAGPRLAGLEHTPGQDLMLSIAVGALESLGVVRRRYTIRALDAIAGTVTLDVVLHGDGPGATWAATARPGDRVAAVGPRGKVVLDPDAAWHLFVGDDSFAPAALSMAEAAPADATLLLVLDVAGPDDEPQHAIAAPDTQVVWVHRDGGAPEDATRLLDALGRLELPVGTGHAYVGAEMGVVREVSAALRARGLADDRISGKPYWRHGVANAPHGEPDRS
jgi:NADPH-dependent ferric siderophore reductase